MQAALKQCSTGGYTPDRGSLQGVISLRRADGTSAQLSLTEASIRLWANELAALYQTGTDAAEEHERRYCCAGFAELLLCHSALRTLAAPDQLFFPAIQNSLICKSSFPKAKALQRDSRAADVLQARSKRGNASDVGWTSSEQHRSGKW